MLSRILLPSLARVQCHQSVKLLSQRVPQICRTLGTKHNSSLIKLQQQQSIALFSTHSARQSMAAAEVATEIETKEVVEGEIVDQVEQVKKPLRFDQIEGINPLTLRSLDKVFKYKEMSVVQEAVLSRMPKQDDMFVKAKTGTGKTLAFLVAALETALAGTTNKDLKHCEGTSILVVSPTRELAFQIADEASKLTKFYPFQVHCLVGGDSKRAQIAKMERGRCDIVVATPGRLNDMLSTVRHLKRACESLKVLVLDEADQLLDMGFKQELQRILSHLPEKRQTMLFSATISNEIRKNLGDFALSPKYELIDTVGKDEVNTHLHVKQSAIVAPYENQLQLVQNLLETHKAANSGKVIVFLPTTKQTMVYAQLFKYMLPTRVVHEIHSRKTQDQRSRIAARFRKSTSDILFTSDVSARGVDYPGVSLVLQIGVPSSREQYIHRLGRTGRAGREGEGILVAAPFESHFLKNDIADLPVGMLEAPVIDEEKVAVNERAMTFALKSFDEDAIREVYTGYLGYYSGRMPQLGKSRSHALVEAKAFLEGLGVTDIPYLSARFKQQLGLDERTPSRSRNNDRYGDRRNNDRSQRYGDGSRSDRGGFRSNSGSFERRDGGDFKPRRSFRDDNRGDSRPNRFSGDESKEYRAPRSFTPRHNRSDDNPVYNRRSSSSFGSFEKDKPSFGFDDKPRRSRRDNDDFGDNDSSSQSPRSNRYNDRKQF